MPFCSHCGQELPPNTKFCPNCGVPTLNANPEVTPQRRREVFDGEIHKCPNCGEVLESFEVVCPACGYELRGTKAASSVQLLATEIAAIEASRPKAKSKSFREIFLSDSTEVNETDSRIASAIQHFPIPNTKEDILEFIILAASNVDTNALDKTSAHYSIVSVAWASKLDQAYQKATISFGDTQEFQQIQELYKQKHKKIKAGFTGNLKSSLKFLGAEMVILVGIIILCFFISSITNSREKSRLENIEYMISQALDAGDYKLAMMNAISIEYNGSDKEQQRKWPIQRTYWIEKVFNKAAENGIDLEYMLPKEPVEAKESEEPEETPIVGFFGGFIQGFQEAIKPSPSPSP